MAEYLPRKNFDILLDVAGLRSRETHDDFEKLFAVCLGLGDSKRTESLEVAADSVLLLDRETNAYKGLEKVNGVHAGNVALILALPGDAADANAVLGAVLGSDRLKIGMNSASDLVACELHQSTLRIPFLLCPSFGHGVQISVEFQDSLGGVDRSIRVEVLVRPQTTSLLQSGGANQGWGVTSTCRRRSPVLSDSVGHGQSLATIVGDGQHGWAPHWSQRRWGTNNRLRGSRDSRIMDGSRAR
jgi:hypothetical protein